jgi:hypothetical protein
MLIPTTASAHAGNSSPDVIHACIGNLSRIVRVVGVSGSCISSPPWLAETPVHWAIEGGTRAAGPCYDNTNRYVDCGNGTVTDTVTGLIWLKRWDCLGFRDWAAANEAAADLNTGECGLTDASSHGDWRLPTKAEWEATIASAVARGCTGGSAPSLTNNAGTACYGDGTASSFAGLGHEGGVHWSSTGSETFPINAWRANLLTGSVNLDDKVDAWQVWPVRGGGR